jgi:hypothetical protein
VREIAFRNLLSIGLEGISFTLTSAGNSIIDECKIVSAIAKFLQE